MSFTVDARIDLNESQLNEALRGQGGEVDRAGTLIASRITRRAKELVGVKTGLLQSTIRTVTNREGDELAWDIIAGDFQADYAWWHSEGSRGFPGNPFLEDAASQIFGEI